MEELINLGISEDTLKYMLDLNPNLKDITSSEITTKISILKKINCSSNQVLNIISSNSLYLTKTNEDIITLINYLLSIGFDNLNILFDSNPYILNLEPYEIDNYLNKRKNNNELIDNIIDNLDSNPYLFNEM